MVPTVMVSEGGRWWIVGVRWYLGFYLFSLIGSLSPPGTALKSFLSLAVWNQERRDGESQVPPPNLPEDALVLVKMTVDPKDPKVTPWTVIFKNESKRLLLVSVVVHLW